MAKKLARPAHLLRQSRPTVEPEPQERTLHAQAASPRVPLPQGAGLVEGSARLRVRGPSATQEVPQEEEEQALPPEEVLGEGPERDQIDH